MDRKLKKEELKTAGCTNGKPEKVKSTEDGPPDDIRAFFGHPLTAATASVNEEDKHASAVALLHEYINLPALDKSGMKIGDKINSIYDIMRDDGSSAKADHDNNMIVHNGDVGEYIELLQTTLASEVDKFFNSDNGEITTVTLPVVEDTVNLTGEVLQEICVQTSNEEDLFTTISDTNILTNGIEPVMHPATTQSENLNMTIPVAVAGYPTDLTRRNSDMRETLKYDGNKSPVLHDISQHKPSKGRQKPEQKQQTQEISKKLVKALSEKILKRQLSQQAEVALQKGNVHDNETKLTPPTTTSCAVLNGIPSHSVAQKSNLSYHPATSESQTRAVPSEVHSDVNISESAKVHGVSVGPKDTIAVCKTIIPESTSTAPPLTVSSHTQSYASPHVRAQVPVAPEKVQYIHSPVPVQCIPNVHGTAAENSNDPVKFQQYLANCGSVPLSHTNQNNHVINSAASGAASVPVQDYYQNTNYPYVYQLTPPLDAHVDRDILLERYLQQQNAYFQEQTHLQYQGHQAKDSYGMKSPDSGYNEASSVSTHEQSHVQPYKEPEPVVETKTMPKSEKVGRRRRSAPPMYVKQYWHSDKNLTPLIPKLEVDPTGYKYYLESPISTTQRIEEDRITYVNKGQYYGLTLEHHGDREIKSPIVKSVIMVVFRADKHLDDESKAWEFWHSRQHSYKQRVLDIDTKNSVGVGPSNVDEISHNAVAVRWNPRNSHVKVNIAVHCLSTDFSNQKGVKGFPLHVQIDTFENMKDTLPVSRAYCQIKVFCDKGAERKTRDEEKRKSTKIKVETQAKSRKRHEDVFHSALERSEFYAMADLTTQPVLFSPTYEGEETVTRVSPVNLTNDEDGSCSITSSGEEGYYPAAKRSRTDSYTPPQTYPNILLYVREKHENVFTALMLRTPTLHGLSLAVEEKYKIPVLKIKNAYKRSKKGILVRLDDNIIRHYSHEATFVIELNCVSEEKDYEIILTEIDVN